MRAEGGAGAGRARGSGGVPGRGGERGELGALLKMAEPATNMSAPASAISAMFAADTPPSTCGGGAHGG